MKKLRLIIVLTIVGILVAPAVFAKSTSPVYIKKAEVFTKDIVVAGELTICSKNHERTGFNVKAENVTAKTLYSRKLMLQDSGCQTFDLQFNKDFSMISNAGDKIKFTLKNIKGKESHTKYSSPKPYYTSVEERDEKPNDPKGGDDLYTADLGDFITHTPTGVRIKVISYDKKRVDLMITGLRWGGIKKLRVYEDRTRKITAGNRKGTKLSISYAGTTAEGGANILIETN